MRRISIGIFIAMCVVGVDKSPAQAQAQPLIVDLAITALRGLTYGAATKGGEALYEGLTKTPNSESRSSPPTPGPVQSPNIPSSTVPGASPPQIVPIDPPTPPDGIHWRMRNDFGANITVQFYSESRRPFHWPAGPRAYLLVSGQPVTIRLRCVPGEKICYGGAVSGRYWGVGLGPRSSCAGCCRICGSEGNGVALR
jgi:hypothetical protein